MADSFEGKKVLFIQHKLPGLEAGEYKIVVDQTLDKSGRINEDLGQSEHTFGVEAPRFQINPKHINSVYPPENSQGNFTGVIPHVVLNHPSLAWMRSPLNKEANKASFNVSGDDENPFNCDVPTWLAVILIQEEDLEDPEMAKVKTVKVKDLFPAGLGDTHLSQFTGTTHNDPGIGQSMEDNCQVIDIPATLFSEIAPSVEDLFMMAHLRQVKLDNKPIQPEDKPADVGTFATIIGNRLPEMNKKATAHLVSLEGMQNFLPKNDGTSNISTTDEKKLVRLVCFKSWNFSATGSFFGFEDSLKKLNNGTSKDEENIKHPRLHLALDNLDAASDKIKNALKLGYVPMNHTTRLGYKSVAWYRGPLSPYPIDVKTIDFLDSINGREEQVVDSADELLRFDPSIGMFDVSYSSAWQLGRLLAIQDRQFSSSLYKWKREREQSFIADLESEILNDVFSNNKNGATKGVGLIESKPKSSGIFGQALKILSDFSKPQNENT